MNAINSFPEHINAEATASTSRQSFSGIEQLDTDSDEIIENDRGFSTTTTEGLHRNNSGERIADLNGNANVHSVNRPDLYSMMVDHECLYTYPISHELEVTIFARSPEELASLMASISKLLPILAPEELIGMFGGDGIICARSLITDNGIEIPSGVNIIHIHGGTNHAPVVCQLIGSTFPNLPTSSLRSNPTAQEEDAPGLSQKLLSDLKKRFSRQATTDAVDDDMEIDNSAISLSRILEQLSRTRSKPSNHNGIIELESDNEEGIELEELINPKNRVEQMDDNVSLTSSEESLS